MASSFFTNYTSVASNYTNPNSKIARLAVTGKPQEDFLFANITEFKDSKKVKAMLEAQRYFGNDNTVINDKKRYFHGREGSKHELTALSNTKLSHPFVFKLVTQKINYLLSNEFEIDTKDTKYKDLLKVDYFNKKFLRTLKRSVHNAVINGLSWVQVYYDDAGLLNFKRIPSDEVIPFWSDDDHTILDAVIRFYTILEYQPSGGKKEITKVEYYDKSGVWYYELKDGKLLLDKEKAVVGEGNTQVPQANFVAKYPDEAGQEQTDNMLWTKIPFVCFKYNSDEIPLLKLIKPMVDDYDETSSELSNMIKDIPNAIKVIKGYSGEDKEEFARNLAIFRTLFVAADGAVDSLDTPIDATPYDSQLDRLRQDIHHFASAVDTQNADLGNASGVAIQFRYADLDIDMSNLEGELQQSFEELAFFIDLDLQMKGKGDFTASEFEIEFNKVSVMNESEMITNAKESTGVISDETILSHHPWVKDPTAELARLKKERQDAMDEFNDGGINDNNSDKNLNNDKNNNNTAE